jgi:hypothetical protein
MANKHRKVWKVIFRKPLLKKQTWPKLYSSFLNLKSDKNLTYREALNSLPYYRVCVISILYVPSNLREILRKYKMDSRQFKNGYDLVLSILTYKELIIKV